MREPLIRGGVGAGLRTSSMVLTIPNGIPTRRDIRCYTCLIRKQIRRDAREAEGAPLLREYRVKSLIEGSTNSSGTNSDAEGGPELSEGRASGMMRAYPERNVGSPRCPLLHLFDTKTDSERCPRGRRGSPAKGVSGQKPDRGFESLSLRHYRTSFSLTSMLQQRIIRGSLLRFNAPVAQLDRVPGYELGGREFESLRARHSTKGRRFIPSAFSFAVCRRLLHVDRRADGTVPLPLAVANVRW